MEKEEFRICPFCKSKIPASLDECPVCNRVIVERPLIIFSDKINKEKEVERPIITSSDKIDKDSLFGDNDTSKTFSRKKHNFKKILICSSVILLIIAIILIAFWPRPVTYRIGDLDSRFKISTDTVVEIVNDAAERWNKTSGKNLLIYKPNGKVRIDFIYDNRQEFIDECKKIDEEYQDLATSETLLVSLKYSTDKEESQYNNDVNSLNGEIQYWNSQGGAPPDVYNQIIIKEKELKSRKLELEKSLDKYNELVSSYNRRLSERNQKLLELQKQYNKSSSGEEDYETVGEYYTDNNDLIIYTFSDQKDLRLILMHELGHALGCEHAKSTNSIMYPKISDQNLDDPLPTEEDLSLISGRP